MLIEIVATYFISIAASIVVIFVILGDCVARNHSISAPFVFILKSTVPSSLLCHECDDQAAKSKVQHCREFHFKMMGAAGLQSSSLATRRRLSAINGLKRILQ